jgi:hypothetical protein
VAVREALSQQQGKLVGLAFLQVVVAAADIVVSQVQEVEAEHTEQALVEL